MAAGTTEQIAKFEKVQQPVFQSDASVGQLTKEEKDDTSQTSKAEGSDTMKVGADAVVKDFCQSSSSVVWWTY